MVAIASGLTPLVPTRALWSWVTSGNVPVVSGYPLTAPFGTASGVYAATKTGITPTDLQNFIGVPLEYYGKPIRPVPSDVIQGWIRFAEDSIEQETTILLCQTWVASPPAMPPQQILATGLQVSDPTLGQQPGIDYDLADAAYDFFFPRAQDEGWMYQTLRYRPVQSVKYSAADYTAVKNIVYQYPLLNEFFRVPPSWIVEDRDYGLIRQVPAANVQMLPLFAMQLAFMGFAESVPGALWLQYTAGLTANDYRSRYSFMRELVLVMAAITALTSISPTINRGVEAMQTQVDGLMYRTQFPKTGPYGPQIELYERRRKALMEIAKSKVAGPMVGVI